MMYWIENLDLAVAREQDIQEALTLVMDGAVLAMRLLSSDSERPPFAIRTGQGKKKLILPWLPLEIAAAPVGETELAGNGPASDVPAHIDAGDEMILNVHATQKGVVRATFIPGLREGHFDHNGDVSIALDKLPNQQIYPESIEVAAGDVLCFRGGEVAHQFTSLTQNRTSYVRLFHTPEKEQII